MTESNDGAPPASAAAATDGTTSAPTPAPSEGPAPGAASAASPGPKLPGRYGRAEGAARRAVLFIGAGVVAYVVGGFVMNGLAVRLGERLGPIDAPITAWLLQWILLRTWLWAVLPAVAWAAGRYLEVSPYRFAATAVISGELFSLLLATASDGLEYVLGNPADIALRLVTLAAGGALAVIGAQRGLAGADAAQLAANAEAERRKAEYAEFLARAEGKPRE